MKLFYRFSIFFCLYFLCLSTCESSVRHVVALNQDDVNTIRKHGGSTSWLTGEHFVIDTEFTKAGNVRNYKSAYDLEIWQLSITHVKSDGSKLFYNYFLKPKNVKRDWYRRHSVYNGNRVWYDVSSKYDEIVRLLFGADQTDKPTLVFHNGGGDIKRLTAMLSSVERERGESITRSFYVKDTYRKARRDVWRIHHKKKKKTPSKTSSLRTIQTLSDEDIDEMKNNFKAHTARKLDMEIAQEEKSSQNIRAAASPRRRALRAKRRLARHDIRQAADHDDKENDLDDNVPAHRQKQKRARVDTRSFKLQSCFERVEGKTFALAVRHHIQQGQAPLSYLGLNPHDARVDVLMTIVVANSYNLL